MIGNNTVTLCMIAKDEEELIGKCIDSVAHLVYRIIVIDTGSIDETARRAADKGAEVFNFEWSGDFAAARNFALEQLRSDWVLVLDADETLAPVTNEAFQELLKATGVEGYFLHIHNYLGMGDAAVRDQVVRLFRNKPEYRFTGAIHEQVAPSILAANHGGGLATAPLVIHHHGYRHSRIVEKAKSRRNCSIIRHQLEQDPGNPLLLYYLAVEHYQQGEVIPGLECLERALGNMLYTDGYFRDIVFNLALGLAVVGDWEKLITHVDHCLEMISVPPSLLLLRGIAYFETGRYREAAQELNQALDLVRASPIRPEALDYISVASREAWTCTSAIGHGYSGPHLPAVHKLGELLWQVCTLILAQTSPQLPLVIERGAKI